MKPYFRFLPEDRSPSIGTTRKNNKEEQQGSQITRPGQAEERRFGEIRNWLFESVGGLQSNCSGRVSLHITIIPVLRD